MNLKNNLEMGYDTWHHGDLKISMEKEQIFDIFNLERKMSGLRSRHVVLWSLETLTGQ
jgi:hypothetical protein